jgi:hypothetical protein
MNKLDEMLTAGATQLEIAAALPYRSWQAIRRRIILLRGPGFEIPESGHLEDGETYEAYLSRELSVAGTMDFPAGGSLERQIARNWKHDGSGVRRLNVVVLPPGLLA